MCNIGEFAIFVVYLHYVSQKEEERKLFDDSNAVFDVPPRINEWNRTNLKRRTGKESMGNRRQGT